MRVLTINELMRLTRTELCGLLARITAELPTYREGSPQRSAAFINLRNIRAVLARRDLRRWRPAPRNTRNFPGRGSRAG